MKWVKYTIESTIEAEDIISCELAELGVEGVQIEDSLPLSFAELEAMYVDPDAEELMPDSIPDIDGSRISFYIRITDGESDINVPVKSSDTVDASYTIHDRLWDQEEVEALIGEIRNRLNEMSAYVDIGTGRITADYTEETEWIDKWKEYYKPLVAANILVIPYWEDVPSEYQVATEDESLRVVRLNPGSAFGSGSHETTRLCMELIEKYLKKGDRFIDIGAGSGILGLAALSNGASYVYSVELDPACEHIMQENMELNGISEDEFRIGIGNILEDDEMRAAAGDDYDVLAANILAPVTITLSGPGQADSLVRKGGFFITSGIAKYREDEVKAAFMRNPEWRIIDSRSAGDWTALVCERI